MSGRTTRWLWGLATLVACLSVNPYVRGDGNGYYAWLVSPVIDGDVDFTNQFERADPLFQRLIFVNEGEVWPEMRTASGRVGNQWSVGPAVLWTPFFLAAHGGVLAARTLGVDVAADGYSAPYLWTVSAGTVLYGMVALWLAARIATTLGYGRGSTVGVLGIGLASALPVYQVFLPFHVHALAACVVAAFLWWGLCRHDPSRIRHWIVWGALAGLMVQVYHLNAVLLLVVVVAWAQGLHRDGLRAGVRRAAAFGVAALVAVVPHLVGKTLVYGRPWITGYQDQFFWTEPRLWDTAWSANHGWLLWTPIVIPALVGLVLVWRRHPGSRSLVAAMVLFYVVVASYQNWHGQSSFGNRFFVSLSAPLVLGLAALADAAWARGRTARTTLAALVAAMAVWNAGFAFQWGTNIIPNRGPVSMREVGINQVTVVPARMSDFVVRYLRSRQDVRDDVERGDIEEQHGHRVVR